MTVLDASVLIAFLDPGDVHHTSAVDLLLDLDGTCGASMLTLGEVLVGPARAGVFDDALGAITALGIEELPFGAGAHGGLAHLRAETGLKMPDCCVLHTALRGPHPVATFDPRLAKACRERGLGTLPS